MIFTSAPRLCTPAPAEFKEGRTPGIKPDGADFRTESLWRCAQKRRLFGMHSRVEISPICQCLSMTRHEE
jgi:hypothetical protein